MDTAIDNLDASCQQGVKCSASRELARAALHIAGMPLDSLNPIFSKTGLTEQRETESREGSSTIAFIKKARPQSSSLNSSGAPIQLCLSQNSQQRKTDVRILLDPFHDLAAQARYEKSVTLVSNFAVSIGQTSLFENITPANPAPAMGGLWLAGILNPHQEPFSDGFAVYLNTEILSLDPCDLWQSVCRCLDAILPESTLRSKLLDAVRAVSRPVSIAIEVPPAPHDQRIKLYLRPSDPNFRSIISLFAAEQIPCVDFDLMKPGAAWPSTGLTFGISFSARSGEVDGTKLDFCVCPNCLRAAKVDDQLQTRLSKKMMFPASLIKAGRPAIIGFGDGAKGHRLNVYFEPRL